MSTGVKPTEPDKSRPLHYVALLQMGYRAWQARVVMQIQARLPEMTYEHTRLVWNDEPGRFVHFPAGQCFDVNDGLMATIHPKMSWFESPKRRTADVSPEMREKTGVKSMSWYERSPYEVAFGVDPGPETDPTELTPSGGVSIDMRGNPFTGPIMEGIMDRWRKEMAKPSPLNAGLSTQAKRESLTRHCVDEVKADEEVERCKEDVLSLLGHGYEIEAERYNMREIRVTAELSGGRWLFQYHEGPGDWVCEREVKPYGATWRREGVEHDLRGWGMSIGEARDDMLRQIKEHTDFLEQQLTGQCEGDLAHRQWSGRRLKYEGNGQSFNALGDCGIKGRV